MSLEEGSDTIMAYDNRKGWHGLAVAPIAQSCRWGRPEEGTSRRMGWEESSDTTRLPAETRALAAHAVPYVLYWVSGYHV